MPSQVKFKSVVGDISSLINDGIDWEITAEYSVENPKPNGKAIDLPADVFSILRECCVCIKYCPLHI